MEDIIEQPFSGRSNIKKTGSSLRIEIPSRKNWFIIFFLGVWLGGWVMGESFALGALFLSDTPLFANGFIFVWLIAWTTGGFFAISFFLWQLVGKVITVDRRILTFTNSHYPKIIMKLKILLFTLSMLLSNACTESENSVQVTANFNQLHQTIEGFGTCLVTYRDYPPEYNDPDFLDRVVNDLGISIMRIPVMEHTEFENDDADPDHFNWNGFYLQNNHRRKGMEEEMKLFQEFKKRGVARFMATPWSPPQFLKTNRSPIKGGHLRADMTEEFAEFLAAYIILAKKNYDIDINWMSIQNELLFAQFFRSCVYQPYVLREAVRSVNRKFEREGINTKILMPEDMMFPDRMLGYIKPTMFDPETRNFNGHFSTHRKAEGKELQQWMDSTRQYNRQNWMTETSGHIANWQGAMQMAADIHDYLVNGNFSAWVYWQLSGGKGENIEQEGMYNLMVAGQPTPKYFAAKHFYKFVRPGAIRTEATTDTDSLRIATFKHEVDGTFTFVLINEMDREVTAELTIQSDVIPESFAVYRSTEKEQCKKLDDFRFSEIDQIKLPARSIITLQGFHPDLQIKDKVELAEAWKIPGDADTRKWGNSQPLDIEKEWQREADGNASLLAEAQQMVADNQLDKTRFNGWTILHDAILQGDGEAVKYLLENGANVNAKADDGWTPLHMAAAIFGGNERLENKNQEFGKYDIFKMVLQARPEIDATTNDGWTPLHAAVANAYTGWRQDKAADLNRIQDLIIAGADINAKDDNGRTPLHWNAWQGYAVQSGLPSVESDVTALLLDNGAAINQQDKLGRTALHYAAEMGYEKIVYVLVQAEADQSITDQAGKTAEDLANTRALPDIIYILKNGQLMAKTGLAENLNSSQDGKLGEELVKAAWNGDLKKVQELLEQGADVDYVDQDGFKAIDRARDNGHKEIVQILQKNMEQ